MEWDDTEEVVFYEYFGGFDAEYDFTSGGNWSICVYSSDFYT